jgi:hypothetical protein
LRIDRGLSVEAFAIGVHVELKYLLFVQTG